MIYLVINLQTMMTKTPLLIMAAIGICLTLPAGNPGRISLGPTPTFSSSSKPILSSEAKVGSIGDYNEDQPKNVIKMNLSQIALRNFSFQYERALHENLSVACGLSFLLVRPFPGAFSKDDPSGEGLRSPTYKGWAITPEFRYYPGGDVEEKPAPHGFYVAAYLRYAKYQLTSEYYEKFSDGTTYGYDYNLTYKGANLGLMIGSQWIIGKHFSIDWWILGAGYGKARFSMEAVGHGINMDASDQAEVKASVEGEFDDSAIVFGQKVEVTTTSNSVMATVKGLPMISLRGFGLCLGFAF
jgi:hypothetical protein